MVLSIDVGASMSKNIKKKRPSNLAGDVTSPGWQEPANKHVCFNLSVNAWSYKRCKSFPVPTV